MRNDILEKYMTVVDGAKSLLVDYASVGLEHQRAGLIDHLTTFRFHLCIANQLGIKLVLPERILDGHHNQGRNIKLDWYKYFDLEGHNVTPLPIDPVQKMQPFVHEGVFPIVEAYQGSDKARGDISLFKDLKRPEIKFSKAIQDLASTYTEKHDIGLVVHIRGGDRITHGYLNLRHGRASGADVVASIDPAFVNQVIEERKTERKTYIMTLLDPTPYNGISSVALGIDAMKNVDNYLLFCIEQQIATGKTIDFISPKELIWLWKDKQL
jgi:hypothetical protein